MPTVPGEAGKWGFLQGRVEKTKAQAFKIPVLCAPYPWKLEAMIKGDRKTGLNLTLVFMSYVFFCKSLNPVLQFPHLQNASNIIFIAIGL